ncbi:MAG: protease HtpX [Pseudomonadaceae bacterium]|nr:protease HtpX [Pseudomonadaceae bacterium]
MLRIALLIGTNIAILLVASIVMSIFGLDDELRSATGFNVTANLIFAGVFGMTGAFISLLISKWMAKRSMGVHVIEQPSNNVEQWLVQTVERQAREADIGMPEVGIFESAQPNAFATGANKNNALVAVSTGLLDAMSKDEVGAVLGHEIGHVANGDMITLTLIQGVMNTFVIFLARLIGFFVDKVILKNERGFGIGYFVTYMAAQVVLGILASTVVMWFSRYREFRADEAGARLANRSSMIRALERLKSFQQMPDEMPETMAAFGISSGLRGGLKNLFSSHPPLDDRIAALQRMDG